MQDIGGLLFASGFAFVMGGALTCLLVMRYGFTRDTDAPVGRRGWRPARVGHALAGALFGTGVVLAIIALTAVPLSGREQYLADRLRHRVENLRANLGSIKSVVDYLSEHAQPALRVVRPRDPAPAASAGVARRVDPGVPVRGDLPGRDQERAHAPATVVLRDLQPQEVKPVVDRPTVSSARPTPSPSVAVPTRAPAIVVTPRVSVESRSATTPVDRPVVVEPPRTASVESRQRGADTPPSQAQETPSTPPTHEATDPPRKHHDPQVAEPEREKRPKHHETEAASLSGAGDRLEVLERAAERDGDKVKHDKRSDWRPARRQEMPSADRPERVEKRDRPERLERAERPERPERVERVERVERPEKIEKAERVERPERRGK